MQIQVDQKGVDQHRSDEHFKDSLRLLRKAHMDSCLETQKQIERCQERDEMSNIRYHELKNMAVEDRSKAELHYHELSMLMNTILEQVSQTSERDREARGDDTSPQTPRGRRRRSSSSGREERGNRRRAISPEPGEPRDRVERRGTEESDRESQKENKSGRGRSRQATGGCNPSRERRRRRSRSRSDSDRESNRNRRGHTRDDNQFISQDRGERREETPIPRNRGRGNERDPPSGYASEPNNRTIAFESFLNPNDTTLLESIKNQGEALKELTQNLHGNSADKALGLPAKFEGKFGGESGDADGEEISEWVESVRRCFSAKRCDDKTGRLLLEKCLGKDALLYIRAEDPRRLLTYEQCLVLMLDRYSSPQSKDNCRTEFRRAQQMKDETLGHFMDRIRRYRTIGYPDEDRTTREEEIIKQFIENIYFPELRVEMEKYFVKIGYLGLTTKRVLKETEDTFKVHDREKKRNEKEGRQGVGHWSDKPSMEPVRSSERLQRRSDESRSCNFCNKTGHYSNQCPNRIGGNKEAMGQNTFRPITVNQIEMNDKEYRRDEEFHDEKCETILLSQDPGRLAVEMIYVLRRLEEVDDRKVNLIWCYDCGQVGHTRKDCKSDLKGLALFMPNDVKNNKVMQVPIVQRPVVDRQMVLDALKEVMKQIQFTAPFAISPCGYCNSSTHNTGPDCPGLVKEIEEKSKNLAEPQIIQTKQVPNKSFPANNRETLYPHNQATNNRFAPATKRFNRIEDHIQDEQGPGEEESLN